MAGSSLFSDYRGETDGGLDGFICFQIEAGGHRGSVVNVDGMFGSMSREGGMFEEVEIK